MNPFYPGPAFTPKSESRLRLASTVYGHEFALLFRYGKVQAELEPGRHVRWGPGWSVLSLPKWPTAHQVSGQEVLTQDGAPVRVSVSAVTRVDGIRKAYDVGPEFSELLHTFIQGALRTELASQSLQNVMEAREGLADRVKALVEPECVQRGYALDALTVRDLVLGGELKRAYYDRLTAQLQSEANLERARGESATLRSLANSARMLREHPGLPFLRLIASIEKGKSTVVFGADALNLPSIIEYGPTPEP